MRGWLIHNHFFFTESFRLQTERLLSAAGSLGDRLDRLTNVQVRSVLVGASPDPVLPDYVLFWDKDFALARELEKRGVPVFNPADAIRLCDSKIDTYLTLTGTGIRMPETVPVPFSFSAVDWNDMPFTDEAAGFLDYPLVVKAACGSFGQQVWLVNNRVELVARLNALSPEPALLQRYIRFSKGRDRRLYVIDGKVAAAMTRISDTDFRANIALGGRGEVCEPTAEETEVALAACERLGLLFGGVDLLFGEDGRPYLCEVNSNAHIRNLSDLSGVDLAAEILKAVRTRVRGRNGS